MKYDAVLSPCGKYRYTLTRDFTDSTLFDKPHLVKTALWIMLNPSTADARQDDPTIRRVIDFSIREGANRVVVVNLFARRATDPAALLRCADPVGPENDEHIAREVASAGVLIAAWGAYAMVSQRDRAVLGIVGPHRQVMCLGTTKTGAPRHPLYVPAAFPILSYQPRLRHEVRP